MRVGLLTVVSKMDQRTSAGVIARFTVGLAFNYPLQTIYQFVYKV